MFRDEGAEPSIEFKRRMNERVGRTPTPLLVVAMPFLAAARLILVAHDQYVKVRCAALARQINSGNDLRTTWLR